MRSYLIISLVFLFKIVCIGQVGINTITPKSTLDINGNLSVKEIGIINANVSGSAVFYGGPSGSATQINDGVYISLTPTASNQEFIMPNAVDVPGRVYILRNVSDTIDAQMYSFGGNFFHKSSKVAASAPLILSTNSTGKSIIIISDGQNWTYFD